jgi:hypothetical protein
LSEPGVFVENLHLRKRKLTGRLNDLRIRILSLSKLNNREKVIAKSKIKLELIKILDDHKRDTLLKESDSYFYSKISKNIASAIFLLERIK